MIMTPEEALEILNSDTLFKIQKDTSLSIRIAIETLIKDRENLILKNIKQGGTEENGKTKKNLNRRRKSKNSRSKKRTE